MTRTELVARLAESSGLTRAAADRVVRALFDPHDGIFAETMRAGGKVSIPGFGTFTIRRRLPRRGRNPRTGQEIRIPATTSIGFSPAASLKDAVSATKARSRASAPVTRGAEKGLEALGHGRGRTGAGPHASAPSEDHELPGPAPELPGSARGLPASAGHDPGAGREPGEAGAEPPDEAGTAVDGPGNVQFTVRHPKEIASGRWYPLLAYAHLPRALPDVLEDSRIRLGRDDDRFGRGKAQATAVIRPGADITVVPEMPGCRFNPKRAGFTWLKDWHRAEFEVQATPDEPGFEVGRAVNGRVAYYVGPVLVGEVAIWAHIADEAETGAADPPTEAATGEAYRKIFVSYSHQDAAIVDALERAYIALGDSYLRDVRTLRSGEEWNPALLTMIEQADVFQLCWSMASQQSKYVMQELRHALAQHRSSGFIRPTYWETPMPPPPEEIGRLHFSRLELG